MLMLELMLRHATKRAPVPLLAWSVRAIHSRSLVSRNGYAPEPENGRRGRTTEGQDAGMMKKKRCSLRRSSGGGDEKAGQRGPSATKTKPERQGPGPKTEKEVESSEERSGASRFDSPEAAPAATRERPRLFKEFEELGSAHASPRQWEVHRKSSRQHCRRRRRWWSSLSKRSFHVAQFARNPSSCS